MAVANRVERCGRSADRTTTVGSSSSAGITVPPIETTKTATPMLQRKLPSKKAGNSPPPTASTVSRPAPAYTSKKWTPGSHCTESVRPTYAGSSRYAIPKTIGRTAPKSPTMMIVRRKPPASRSAWSVTMAQALATAKYRVQRLTPPAESMVQFRGFDIRCLPDLRV